MSEQKPRSGLRNPAAAARAVAAGALGAEGVGLLLAIVPLRVLGASVAAIAAVIALAVTSFALVGLLRRPWAWHGGSALQMAVVACGIAFHWSLAALGVLFGLVWIYVLHVRRTVLGRR